MPNSRTTIAIRPASRWLRMKLYMDGSAEPRCSSQTGESQVFGPEVLKDAEKQVQMVREYLKVAQS
jgi:hypothetical protein